MNTPPPGNLPPQYASVRPLSDFSTQITLEQAKRRVYYFDDAAKLGLCTIAAPGTGKSRLLGKRLTAECARLGKPVVVIDPTGGTIDNFLDTVTRLPEDRRRAILSRLIYIDAGARDYLTPMPLYYRLSDDESLFEIADRFPAVLKRQDPALQDAPILGWNSLYECAINAGMIAATLGKQLDFVADLVQHPGRYKEELKQARTSEPRVQTAVDYFRDLMDPTRGSLREKRTGSFLTKLVPFLNDEYLLASFCGEGKGIDWENVSRTAGIVLIDLRHVLNPEHRQFAMIWYFKAFTDFIKHRGMAGRGQEMLLVIDELADMLAQKTSTGQSLLAADLEELSVRHARNYGVNLAVALQSLASVEPAIQNVLHQLGTQIIGRIANPDDALTIAKQLLIYDPYRVKKVENVWMGLSEALGYGQHGTKPTVIDERMVEFTSDEQFLIFADHLKQLPRFTFIVRTATGEGTITHTVRKMTIANLDAGQFPVEPYLAYVRGLLRQAHGVPVAELLAHIDQRRPAVPLEPKPVKRKATPPTPTPLPPHGTLGENHDGPASHSLPGPPSPTAATPEPEAAQTPPADDESVVFR
jgi:DNA helicase HerA-like ATPase